MAYSRRSSYSRRAPARGASRRAPARRGSRGVSRRSAAPRQRDIRIVIQQAPIPSVTATQLRQEPKGPTNKSKF